MNWRFFLPGIFAEAYHWRERALRAEARLGDIIGQFGSAQLAEREQVQAERREFISLLSGKSSQMPPLAAEGDRFNLTESVPSTTPISRRIQEFREQQAKDIPDEVVDLAVEEYLKATAIH